MLHFDGLMRQSAIIVCNLEKENLRAEQKKNDNIYIFCKCCIIKRFVSIYRMLQKQRPISVKTLIYRFLSQVFEEILSLEEWRVSFLENFLINHIRVDCIIENVTQSPTRVNIKLLLNKFWSRKRWIFFLLNILFLQTHIKEINILEFP